MTVVEQITELFLRRGGRRWTDAVLTECDHALQAAALAAEDSAPHSLVVAALFHDVGRIIANPVDDLAGLFSDDNHEAVGARWLATLFGPDVSEPVRLHVTAKRYLCAVHPGYLETLSSASMTELVCQGGPLRQDRVRAFEAERYFASAISLRRYDDGANVPGRDVPPLEHYIPRIESMLLSAVA